MNILLDIVLHPRRYDHVVNVPMQFDAAEFLFKNHLDELTYKQIAKVEEVLLRILRTFREAGPITLNSPGVYMHARYKTP